MKIKSEKKTKKGAECDPSGHNLVWAKMKYCSFWPARITCAPPELGRIPANKICVLFFGTKNYGFVTKENIVGYVQNRMKYVKKCKSKSFLEAVQQMDEFIRDPKVFASNGFINKSNSTLTIKKELVVTNIKHEDEMDVMPFRTEEVECLDLGQQLDKLKEEKTQMIQNILTLKDENQKMHYELRNMQRENDKIRSNFETQIDELKQELSELTVKCKGLEVEKSENEKNISRLNREKNITNAKVKELERYSEGRPAIESESTDEESFEVEAILEHKMVRRQRKFFIKWKHFTIDHNSWVQEKNLRCPELLNAYLKSNNLL